MRSATLCDPGLAGAESARAGVALVEREVARLLELGARQLDAQLNSDLVVLADPEGNEFCLLRP